MTAIKLPAEVIEAHGEAIRSWHWKQPRVDLCEIVPGAPQGIVLEKTSDGVIRSVGPGSMIRMRAYADSLGAAP